MKKFSAEGILLLITLVWGATFVIIKSALMDISPMLFISFRFSIAALLLLPLVKYLFIPGSLKLMKAGVFLGILYFLSFASQTAGLKFTSATKSGFITGTFIIFVPLFQYLVNKKIPSAGGLFGVSLAFLGLLFLSSRGSQLSGIFNIFLETGSDFNIGDFLTLICALFVALYIIYLDKISRKYDYRPLAFLQIATTAMLSIVTCILFSLMNIEKAEADLNRNVVSALIYTSLLATVFATYFQTKYQKRVTPSRAGIIFSFEPIFSALLAFFVLNEKISNFGAIGCLLIFSGLIVSEILEKNGKEDE